MIVEDTALVCEGGGMRNSYSAACICELINNDINFGWVGGISAGASHAINFLSKDTHRTKANFVDIAQDSQAGGWHSFIRGRGYFNSEYIEQQSSAHNTDLFFDYTRYQESTTALRIGVTRADTGESFYFGREDSTDAPTLIKQVRASSTMPLFMPITWIDNIPYVDGALGRSGGIAIDAAQADGFEKFLVLLTRPRDYKRPEVAHPKALRRALRKWPAVAEAMIQRPKYYNATKKLLFELEKQGRAQLFFPETMPVSSRELDYQKLKSSYELGLAQTKREWQSWLKFFAS
ncbi:patatin family protein [Corynebacterium sp. sy017]|uniref:patatin-like phospholipase family protein n=1 Tax=unclassified Corynebacterium TaxID=2624378 RepID=UPI001185F1D2|nr:MULTISPECIES: patatin family protein [unclassified Corynebacterium]MBP3088937.1 patatin family protein [Corynebacterium sp. sy017]TSD91265.1 patatin family protein [Corynebacterium sp. SY003]